MISCNDIIDGQLQFVKPLPELPLPACNELCGVIPRVSIRPKSEKTSRSAKADKAAIKVLRIKAKAKTKLFHVRFDGINVMTFV